MASRFSAENRICSSRRSKPLSRTRPRSLITAKVNRRCSGSALVSKTCGSTTWPLSCRSTAASDAVSESTPGV